MTILPLTFIFSIGSIVGSFLNVVILRYNTGMSPTKGRSVCFHCNKPLSWYEMIPIFSYFFIRGKCISCKTSISAQYPIIEFITGFLFAAIAVRQYYYLPLYSVYPDGLLYSILFFVYYCVVFSVLIVLSAYDIRHKIIPNKLVYFFSALAIAKLLLFFYCFGLTFQLKDMLDLLSPIILFIPFASLWFISSGRWIGFGDAKLAIGIGALLGFVLGLSSIILAFWIGALWSILFIVQNRVLKRGNLNLHSEVPFAPFLILATIIVFFSHIDVLGLNSFLTWFQ